MIRNIVFDIGDVLVEYSAILCAKHYAIDYFQLEAANQILIRDEKWREYLNGLILVEDLLQYFINAYPNQKNEFCMLLEKKYQNEILFLITDNVELLKKVKEEHYQVYLLSNITKETLETIHENYDFIRWVDGGVFSYQEHVSKPDKKIYQILLERYHLEAEETLLIDDRFKNIEVASQLGIKGIQYQKGKQINLEMIRKMGGN